MTKGARQECLEHDYTQVSCRMLNLRLVILVRKGEGEGEGEGPPGERFNKGVVDSENALLEGCGGQQFGQLEMRVMISTF